MAYTEEQIENIKTRILSALEEVIDPELGIDIVNLGLIYEIRFDGDTGQTEIDMTLTTMGCPLADLLTDQIYDAMTDVPEVTDTEVTFSRGIPAATKSSLNIGLTTTKCSIRL